MMVSGDGIVSPAVATYIKIVLLGIGLELRGQSGLGEFWLPNYFPAPYHFALVRRGCGAQSAAHGM